MVTFPSDEQAAMTRLLLGSTRIAVWALPSEDEACTRYVWASLGTSTMTLPSLDRAETAWGAAVKPRRMLPSAVEASTDVDVRFDAVTLPSVECRRRMPFTDPAPPPSKRTEPSEDEMSR